MTSLNVNLILILLIFFINLIVCTNGRKLLTYRGIQSLLILNNLMLLVYCSIYWNHYITNCGTESFAIKLNPNTWTGVIYEISFKINSLSFLFIFLVNIIGFATNIYILNYFKYEERGEEFILLINWFILSMILLVSGNNFFTLILGWELIGLTSFLLINFWKYKITTLGCSFKAFSFNKFSDLFLMISFCVLWNVYKVNNIDTLLTVISFNKNHTNGLLLFSGVCLLISSSIKSAQIFGHLWLPDSMEAPVPASSLIHSATLVSAGIYLILKFQIIFIITDLSKAIFMLGSVTACYGGIVAASQTDVKKLLAYSTISHCGFIFTTISLNNFIITMIYLYLHGLFKAVTFFCVGSLIKHNNTQDMRLMGMSKPQVFNTATLIIASANLGGLPFTFGSLYKQSYLVYLVSSHYNFLGYGFCIIGMLSSVVYVYKLIYYSCFDFRKGSIQTIILYLQNYNTLFKNLFLNFTYVKFFSFFIIYIYSILFYIIVKFYIFKIYIYMFHLPITLINDMKYLTNFFFLKNYLVSLYYIFFSIAILIIILNSPRTNYFYLQKITMLRQFLIFFSALSVINFFTRYLLLFLT